MLVQGQEGAKIQPAGILEYVEGLKRGTNEGIGLTGNFEIASVYHPFLEPPSTTGFSV
jgi:hypothetical protein